MLLELTTKGETCKVTFLICRVSNDVCCWPGTSFVARQRYACN